MALTSREMVQIGTSARPLTSGVWNFLSVRDLVSNDAKEQSDRIFPIRIHPISAGGKKPNSFLFWGDRPFRVPSGCTQFWAEYIGNAAVFADCYWVFTSGTEESDLHALGDLFPSLSEYLNGTNRRCAPAMRTYDNADWKLAHNFESGDVATVVAGLDPLSRTQALPIASIVGGKYAVRVIADSSDPMLISAGSDQVGAPVLFPVRDVSAVDVARILQVAPRSAVQVYDSGTLSGLANFETPQIDTSRFFAFCFVMANNGASSRSFQPRIYRDDGLNIADGGGSIGSNAVVGLAYSRSATNYALQPMKLRSVALNSNGDSGLSRVWAWGMYA